MDAILFSANPKMVEIGDAIRHLANHDELYWEVGFRVVRDNFSYPMLGFIHISGKQVEYRVTIRDIFPFTPEHYEDEALAERVKPEPWRREWEENFGNVRSHPWKTVLVMTRIEPFSHDTYAFYKYDGTLIQGPPRSYIRVLPPERSLPSSFEIGKVYQRRRDIHDRFGGQQRGGISTPGSAPYLFLFTGESGEQYGYHDGWDAEGIYLYTGEGQRGDMDFVRGNRAVRDHAENGKDLLLFQSLEKTKGYQFLGSFVCANWEVRDGPDVDGQPRKLIVFHLLRLEGDTTSVAPADTSTPTVTAHLSIDELRRRAYEAGTSTAGKSGKAAKRIYRERSAAVRDYVLARANGECETCKGSAPFSRPDGTPYLEPHHIHRMSDGGPDHPKWVGAICPNCHKEIHYGANGDTINSRLQRYVEKLEAKGSD